MKTKYAAVIATVVLAAAATLFAVEKQATIFAPKLIHLKSKGTTIAELKLLKGTTFDLTSAEQVYDRTTGQITGKGDVTIRIKNAGGPPVTVKAEEIVILDAQ